MIFFIYLFALPAHTVSVDTDRKQIQENTLLNYVQPPAPHGSCRTASTGDRAYLSLFVYHWHVLTATCLVTYLTLSRDSRERLK